MTTVGQFNSKNPTVRRIRPSPAPSHAPLTEQTVKEASELASNPSADYHAEPLENNLFEWHFTLRGPPAPSPFAGGLYHGRIVLPPAYPLRPPSFRFLTPSGRFEANREICLSISGHHEESWQPAWGMRTALVAIRSFMDTTTKGQIGGLECDAATRRAMAREAPAWTCARCARSNADIMAALEEAVRGAGGGAARAGAEAERVPEELRLAYREDLGEGSKQQGEGSGAPVAVPAPAAVAATAAAVTATATRTDARDRVPRRARQSSDGWIDRAILVVAALLVIFIARKLLSYTR
jgi:ubiquitin-conjugating enzyme E2 J1